MKTLIWTIFIICAGPFSQGARANSEGLRMHGTEIMNCNKTGSKCLRIRSPEMIGSKLKQLEVIKDPLVELIVDGKSRILPATAGYIDLSEARVVLITRNKDGSADERSFDLETLSEKHVRIR